MGHIANGITTLYDSYLELSFRFSAIILKVERTVDPSQVNTESIGNSCCHDHGRKYERLKRTMIYSVDKNTLIEKERNRQIIMTRLEAHQKSLQKVKVKYLGPESIALVSVNN